MRKNSIVDCMKKELRLCIRLDHETGEGHQGHGYDYGHVPVHWFVFEQPHEPRTRNQSWYRILRLTADEQRGRYCDGKQMSPRELFCRCRCESGGHEG